MNSFEFAWYAVLLFLLFGAFFVFIHMVLGKIAFRPEPSETTNLEAYECGEPPVGEAWTKFNNRFWTIAIVFVVFDVEAVFFFPLAASFAHFKEAGSAISPELAFLEVLLFVMVLGVALAYVWAKGDINYYKDTPEGDEFEEDYYPHEPSTEEFDPSEYITAGH